MRIRPDPPYDTLGPGCRAWIEDAAVFGLIDCGATVLDVRLYSHSRQIMGVRVRLDDPPREITCAADSIVVWTTADE